MKDQLNALPDSVSGSIDRSIYRPLFGGVLALFVVFSAIILHRVHALNDFSRRLLVTASASEDLGTEQLGDKTLPNQNTVIKQDQRVIEYKGKFIDRTVVWMVEDWEKELNTCRLELERGGNNCNPTAIEKRMNDLVDFGSRFTGYGVNLFISVNSGNTNDLRVGYIIRNNNRLTSFQNPFGIHYTSDGSLDYDTDGEKYSKLPYMTVMFFALFPFWSSNLVAGPYLFPGTVNLPIL